MAITTAITWESNPEKDFLKDSNYTNIIKNVSNIDINSIIESLDKEMGKGLSREALNIDGYAPLNDIAEEIKTNLKKLKDSIDSISETAKSDGDDHKEKEARNYYEAVTLHYKELYLTLQNAQRDYNENREYVSGYHDDDDGNIVEEKSSWGECIISPSSFSAEEDVEIVSMDRRSPYAPAVDNACYGEEGGAHTFYKSKVTKAKELVNECSSHGGKSAQSTSSSTGVASAKLSSNTIIVSDDTEIDSDNNIIRTVKYHADVKGVDGISDGRYLITEKYKNGEKIEVVYNNLPESKTINIPPGGTDAEENTSTASSQSPNSGNNNTSTASSQSPNSGNNNTLSSGTIPESYHEIKGLMNLHRKIIIPKGAYFYYDGPGVFDGVDLSAYKGDRYFEYLPSYNCYVETDGTDTGGANVAARMINSKGGYPDLQIDIDRIHDSETDKYPELANQDYNLNISANNTYYNKDGKIPVPVDGTDDVTYEQVVNKS